MCTWRRCVCRHLCLGTGHTGSWFTTVLPMLTSSGRKWSSRRRACSGWIRKATEEVNLFASSIILDGKARSETHSDIALVEGDGVGRCCSCGGGLLLGEVPPSSDTCPSGDSTRGGARRGGEFSCCVPARRLDWPTTPEGEAGGRGWGGVTLPTPALLDPSTPRWGEG
jgi:hypothetical protein